MTEDLRELVADLRDRLATARRGGSDAARTKHTDRGKLLVRDRVDRLLDPGSPFLELSPLAATGMYDDAVPSAGIVTGIGRISGRECVVVANDATVKGGTYYPITVKKHLRAQAVAADNRLPCVYLVDSGGAFLPMQDEVFPDREHFGRIFFNQANLSARGIPQIASVMGSCTAGGAYVPAMSDETVIVKEQGTIFLGGPPLVKAATGEVVTAEELGGGDVHARISGVVDHLADDDAQALDIVRSIIDTFERPVPPSIDRHEPEDPHEAPDTLYDVVPADTRTPYDVREVIRRRKHHLEVSQGDALLEMIARESERLAGILDDLLVATRLDSGTMQLSIGQCDGRRIVEEIVALEREAAPAEFELAVVAEEQTPQVACDQERLRQVLMNLVENAIKYSPDGGRVEVALREHEGRVRFSVADEGLGIPQNERERVFEKFYRLDPRLARGVGGTGLGLYISRELVERMEGSIWVESEPGKGSTFHVDLPVAEPAVS